MNLPMTKDCGWKKEKGCTIKEEGRKKVEESKADGQGGMQAFQ